MSGPQLTSRLTLETADRTIDGAGGYSTVWTALGEVWGEIRRGSGRDRERAGLPLGGVSYRITLRAAPAGSPRRPVPGQRLREGTRIYEVLAVADEGPERRYLTVFARSEEVMA